MLDVLVEAICSATGTVVLRALTAGRYPQPSTTRVRRGAKDVRWWGDAEPVCQLVGLITWALAIGLAAWLWWLLAP
ncbi:MAG: hypothetical protein RLZZ127_2908 [Planctomycetota bacterium]|jgi:hypothetical protein